MPVDLSAVATEVWELYEALAEDKGLLCSAEVAPGLSVLGGSGAVAPSAWLTSDAQGFAFSGRW